MEDKFLALTLIVASLGFIIWFTVSTSLMLPVRFQVLYDANPPYVNRIFRRRFFGALIYGIIPLYIIKYTGLLNRPHWSDLNISFQWTSRVGMWMMYLLPLLLIISWITTRKTSNLELFPEVRVRYWRPGIFVGSAVWWIIYLTAYEFFYRGILFQSLRFQLPDGVAVIACTGLYTLSHYFKRNRVSFFSMIYGALACYMVLDTGSILPALIFHIFNALSVEWFSLRYHPEMYLTKT